MSAAAFNLKMATQELEGKSIFTKKYSKPVKDTGYK
jgi:hypothetical protein